jgi:hypothetical protein
MAMKKGSVEVKALPELTILSGFHLAGICHLQKIRFLDYRLDPNHPQTVHNIGLVAQVDQ